MIKFIEYRCIILQRLNIMIWYALVTDCSLIIHYFTHSLTHSFSHWFIVWTFALRLSCLWFLLWLPARVWRSYLILFWYPAPSSQFLLACPPPRWPNLWRLLAWSSILAMRLPWVFFDVAQPAVLKRNWCKPTLGPPYFCSLRCSTLIGRPVR